VALFWNSSAANTQYAHSFARADACGSTNSSLLKHANSHHLPHFHKIVPAAPMLRIPFYSFFIQLMTLPTDKIVQHHMRSLASNELEGSMKKAIFFFLWVIHLFTHLLVHHRSY
jgi:hypothetical protein